MAVLIGCAIGGLSPKTGMALKPLGDAFVSLIRMMIAPVIFCVIVQGIASMSDLKKVGTLGVKTLIYFEAVSTLALIIGLVVAVRFCSGGGGIFHPGGLWWNSARRSCGVSLTTTLHHFSALYH